MLHLYFFQFFLRYQAKQVAFDRTRREEERKRNFLEMDPEPGVAYPLERIRDANRLDRIKGSLRNALDAQVHAKETVSHMKKTINTAEDNYFLGCVQEQLEIDRKFFSYFNGCLSFSFFFLNTFFF